MAAIYKGGIVYRLGEKTPVPRLSDLKPGESIVVHLDGGQLYTCYRAPRHRDESPIEYYKRTRCVDDHYYFKFKGHYYCNPAHCSQTWTNKKKRDEHLDMAYAMLG